MEEDTEANLYTPTFSPCPCPLCSSGDQLGADTVRSTHDAPVIVEVEGDPELSYCVQLSDDDGLLHFLRHSTPRGNI